MTMRMMRCFRIWRKRSKSCEQSVSVTTFIREARWRMTMRTISKRPFSPRRSLASWAPPVAHTRTLLKMMTMRRCSMETREVPVLAVRVRSPYCPQPLYLLLHNKLQNQGKTIRRRKHWHQKLRRTKSQKRASKSINRIWPAQTKMALSRKVVFQSLICCQ